MTKEKIYHPCLDENGSPVLIKHPSSSTGPESWLDPSALAVASRTDSPSLPGALNGLAFSTDFSVPVEDPQPWLELAPNIVPGEPDFVMPPGYRATSGCVVIEPDRRVWVVYPSNEFGGVRCTFPKGRLEPILSLAQNAAKETWEESGLYVEPVEFLCDIVRTHVVTRFYCARRLSGSPALAGWESQAVGLAPFPQLSTLINRVYDLRVLDFLKDRIEAVAARC